jgi:hypothetical protein
LSQVIYFYVLATALVAHPALLAVGKAAAALAESTGMAAPSAAGAELFFLGTGSSKPSQNRNVSSSLLRFPVFNRGGSRVDRIWFNY